MSRQIRTIVLQTAGILAVGVLCGTAANLLRPGRIPWVEDWGNYVEAKALREKITLVTAEQAREIVQGGRHVILDARPGADYQAGHLPGAVSLPFVEAEEVMVEVQSLLSPAQPVLTYCSGESCDESFELTKRLRAQGFTNVVLFAGGFDKWKASGYPVEEGH